MDLGRDEYSYKAERDHLDDAAPCKCSSCGATWRYDQLGPIGDCNLTPGDPSPAGRCADRSCDSLAYPVGEPWVEAVRAAAGLAETLIEDGAFLSAADRLSKVATKLREHHLATLPPGAAPPTLPPLQAILAAGDVLHGLIDDALTTHIYDVDDEIPDDDGYVVGMAAWQEARAKWAEAVGAPAVPNLRTIVVTVDGGDITGWTCADPTPDLRVTTVDLDTDGLDRERLSMVRPVGERYWSPAYVRADQEIEVAPPPEIADAEEERFDGSFGDDDESDRFLNHYECPCGETWSDPSPSQTDDECLKCGTTCSPSESEDL